MWSRIISHCETLLSHLTKMTIIQSKVNTESYKRLLKRLRSFTISCQKQQINISRKLCLLVKSLSRIPMDYIVCQAPPAMGFSRQEYWNGMPLPSPGDLPDPGIKPSPPALKADFLPSEPPGNPFVFLAKSKF